MLKIYYLKQEPNHYWFKTSLKIHGDKFTQNYEESKQN